MAFGWFLRASTISQIVPKDQKPENDYERKHATFIDVPKKHKNSFNEGFQMPLHYPRYKKTDYEKMEEWRIDQLLREYGLVVNGSLQEKRDYAMGAFLWPDQM